MDEITLHDQGPMRKKGMTSVELAKLAGVSSATISRAFAKESRIKPATRKRILALAEEHGFRPNAMARSLNSSKSRLVALVVNTVANPAEGEGLDQLIHRLQQQERIPLLLCCANHEDRSQLMRIASAYQVDHVVLYSDAVSIDDSLEIFRSATVVVASAEPLEGRAVPDVRLDSSAASAEVIDRLAGLGKRRFSYLSGRASSYVDKQRMAWFAAALAQHGLAFEQIVHGDYSYESGFKEAVLLLRRAPTDVLICANDLMAIGAQDAAALLGIVVPDALSIVGHDGVALANWDCHSLTTIMPPRNSVSDALADIIESTPSIAPIQRVIDCEIRWGRSTGLQTR
jgi:DNA-binding LacI/PurR family transcriptional regulator